jgi:hypothetical protein
MCNVYRKVGPASLTSMAVGRFTMHGSCPTWNHTADVWTINTWHRVLQEAIKGSQGAGKVDDALDRTKNDPGPEAEPVGKGSKPPPGRSGKKKGRR